MTPSFSPFLAHLLMAGLARRAMLSSGTPAEPPAPNGTDVAEAAPPPAAKPSSGTILLR
jgi:hypothetical protein